MMSFANRGERGCTWLRALPRTLDTCMQLAEGAAKDTGYVHANVPTTFRCSQQCER